MTDPIQRETVKPELSNQAREVEDDELDSAALDLVVGGLTRALDALPAVAEPTLMLPWDSESP